MQLNDFLRQFIRGYLFEDLKAMSTSPSGQVGQLGYPMLMSAAAGIEMLGVLASPNTYVPTPSWPNFQRYWQGYLYPQSPRRDVADAVYQLVRHGIAHNFAAKNPFVITKGGPAHLVNVGSNTVIDAVRLCDDLVDSYSRFEAVALGTAPGAFGETPGTMQTRLEELIRLNEKKMTAHSPPLAHLPAATPVSPQPGTVLIAPSPTGSLGPIPPAPASSSGIP